MCRCIGRKGLCACTHGCTHIPISTWYSTVVSSCRTRRQNLHCGSWCMRASQHHLKVVCPATWVALSKLHSSKALPADGTDNPLLSTSQPQNAVRVAICQHGPIRDTSNYYCVHGNEGVVVTVTIETCWFISRVLKCLHAICFLFKWYEMMSAVTVCDLWTQELHTWKGLCLRGKTLAFLFWSGCLLPWRLWKKLECRYFWETSTALLESFFYSSICAVPLISLPPYSFWILSKCQKRCLLVCKNH